MKVRFAVSVLFGAVALSACDNRSSTAPLARVDAPIASITHGDYDGDGHPAVVLLIMRERATGYFFGCSATMLSPTVVLTAGHCTGQGGDAPDGEFSDIWYFTGPDQSGTLFIGPENHAASWTSHPSFTKAEFYLHDVGVVVLNAPGVVLADGQYGVLPSSGQLDVLKASAKTIFTSVGYGDNKVTGSKVENGGLRMVAMPRLLNINDKKTGTYSLLLSNNAATGGTCFGDSGGPNYLGTSNTIAGVTSFALNNNCTSNGGGVFRLDKQDVLEFVNGFLH